MQHFRSYVFADPRSRLVSFFFRSDVLSPVWRSSSVITIFFLFFLNFLLDYFDWVLSWTRAYAFKGRDAIIIEGTNLERAPNYRLENLSNTRVFDRVSGSFNQSWKEIYPPERTMDFFSAREP